MKMFIRRVGLAALAAWILLGAADIRAAAPIEPKNADKHYTDVGFFDIHICNWPDRNPFYFVLFSTEEYANIDKIEIYYPDHKKMGELDLARYRLIKADPIKKQPEKHIFISNFEKRADNPEGQFQALITMKDGRRYVAMDFVANSHIERAQGRVPAAGAENISMPAELKWEPVPGARYYKVFIKDAFGEQIIYESKLLDKSVLSLPAGLLIKGGSYLWQVHARDLDRDLERGDFNAGSLSNFIEFSVAE